MKLDFWIIKLMFAIKNKYKIIEKKTKNLLLHC